VNKKVVVFLVLILAGAALIGLPDQQAKDPRLDKAFRRPELNGWTFVHLEGSPAEIGYQHGYLLATEIQEMKEICDLELNHDTKREWSFFRGAARDMMWPRIPKEYQEELQGIADGVKARGTALDLWDIVALNGMLEWTYYTKELGKKSPAPGGSPAAPEHCSAFVATGSYTRDGRPVIAHNAWTLYLEGRRWTVIFDIAPAAGHRFLMDGLPGFIASDDDFGINSAGLMITETTISDFEGYDAGGVPEFVRARRAMQYASSIDDFARIMTEGNNGGYANDWLVADRKTGEIASLELGLKNVTLERKKDGYFAGANFPINPKLAREETTFDTGDISLSANARRLRWEQLMAENRGKIDVAAAERFLADHFDTYQKKNEPNERTLCGHVDLSPRGSLPWQPPYGVAGAVQNKAADAAMAERLSFAAAAGHACGLDFKAAEHLRRHPEFDWQKKYLKDVPARPWTVFEGAK
jgi:Phospholipase B